MKKLLLKMKDKFNENKNRNMLILVILILTILSSITLITYSFYQNRSSNLIIAGVASIDKSDVRIKVYREDKDSSGNGTNTYSLSYYIPNETSYSYNSGKTVCDTGITINKYENRIFYVNATKKGTCKVYFDAIDGYIDDYEVNLFVQQEMGNTDDKNYEQMGQLPLYETGYYYTVNTSKTSCNPSATVSIVGRKINVLTNVQTVCNVYVDKNSDSVSPVISSLNVSDTTVTFTATDNISLALYGVSDSSTIEPEEYNSFSGTSQTLSFTQNTEGTYYLWVKDSSNNKTIKEFTISLGTSFAILMTPNNSDIFDENGLRYEGANPNNYICLDNQKSGSCTSSSLLFRIIGLFDEDTSSDGTNSSGSKKLLKVIDTNNYGGTSGKYWNSTGLNNWNTASLKTELNGTYLTTLLGTSNVNSKLSSGVANAKWYLGGASTSNRSELTAEGIYTEERNPNAIYSGNPSSIYAKVGLMYPSDYGYATVGGSTTNKTGCRSEPLNDWNYYQDSTNSDCKDNDWLFISQISFVNKGEFLISPFSSFGSVVAVLTSPGFVHLMMADSASYRQFAVRPTFYLDSDILKIVGGTGSQTSPYHIG